jgi:hypothetical protein
MINCPQTLGDNTKHWARERMLWVRQKMNARKRNADVLVRHYYVECAALPQLVAEHLEIMALAGSG